MDRPDLQQVGLKVPVETPRACYAHRAVDPAGQADAGAGCRNASTRPLGATRTKDGSFGWLVAIGLTIPAPVNWVTPGVWVSVCGWGRLGVVGLDRFGGRRLGIGVFGDLEAGLANGSVPGVGGFGQGLDFLEVSCRCRYRLMAARRRRISVRNRECEWIPSTADSRSRAF
ncbi:MAG: hypothetical protein CM1200mP2_21730 [Planctomycetaceae bacterium]|nr:MAG: hypothetical protein CM1200mP2_21730 [Planctomycetaceae bacterium]